VFVKKVLSRFASPAGFALVLLLFFLMPFVAVSCDEINVRYTGSHLVSGADPEVPAELREFANDADAPATLVDPPDPGAQVLAIVVVVLAVGGMATALLARARTRLLGAAVAAGATLVATIVTMVVAQSSIESALFDRMRETAVADDDPALLESRIGELIHTEIGFWLMVVLLALIAAATAVLGLFGERLRVIRAEQPGEGGLLSFGKDDT
jgi:hypothetical protein